MSSPPPIRVFIVDDQAVVRSGLRYILTETQDIEVVGEGTEDDTLERCAVLQPDVMLIDINMPNGAGLHIAQRAQELVPYLRVVALTNAHDHQLVYKALQVGVVGYQAKNLTAEELAATIRSAFQGNYALSNDATQALVQKVNQPQPIGHDLSPRERDVLALLTHGLSNRAIATQLQISQNTVRYHVRAILAKLKVTNRTEAATLAILHGLVDITAPPHGTQEDDRRKR